MFFEAHEVVGEVTLKITHVLMRVATDIGHGGPISEYRIEPDEDGYAVTLRISKPFGGTVAGRTPQPQPPSRSPREPPASGGAQLGPQHVTEVLPKGRGQVEEFLRKLAAEFDVYGLSDLRPQHPFLHPTFYSFSFRDSDGGSHGFEYQIECSNHPDERYKRLVREFDSFFESGRVFDKFFESVRRGG